MFLRVEFIAENEELCNVFLWIWKNGEIKNGNNWFLVSLQRNTFLYRSLMYNMSMENLCICTICCVIIKKTKESQGDKNDDGLFCQK